MSKIYDFIGIGVGPFNLSLASLLIPNKRQDQSVLFLDNKMRFTWHQELMFEDASMQTSYLKDLVTPVDPTNPFSFLNYLVKHEQFYQFLNTNRQNISRLEFESYCQWVADELADFIRFNSHVQSVHWDGNLFNIFTRQASYRSRDICVASGPRVFIPPCALPFIGDKVSHVKSKNISTLDLSNKKVLIVGGGQSGIEFFRNSLHNRWGRAAQIHLITGRENLCPLDEGPFTNEIFSPEFVTQFYELDQSKKDRFSSNMLLASDGNTPNYLQMLYNDLYLAKYHSDHFPEYRISPMRWLEKMESSGSSLKVEIRNLLTDDIDSLKFDQIILATGFESSLPRYLEGLREHLILDNDERLMVNQNYQVETNISHNRIYAMNFSRHSHGIADPQTSLMSWRSAKIANQLLENPIFKTDNNRNNFVNYF
jgi:lysine N6-hydroxylase